MSAKQDYLSKAQRLAVVTGVEEGLHHLSSLSDGQLEFSKTVHEDHRHSTIRYRLTPQTNAWGTVSHVSLGADFSLEGMRASRNSGFPFSTERGMKQTALKIISEAASEAVIQGYLSVDKIKEDRPANPFVAAALEAGANSGQQFLKKTQQVADSMGIEEGTQLLAELSGKRLELSKTMFANQDARLDYRLERRDLANGTAIGMIDVQHNGMVNGSGVDTDFPPFTAYGRAKRAAKALGMLVKDAVAEGFVDPNVLLASKPQNPTVAIAFEYGARAGAIIAKQKGVELRPSVSDAEYEANKVKAIAYWKEQRQRKSSDWTPPTFNSTGMGF